MKGIYEYVKDKHGHRLGVVYAIGKEYKDIGWSLCNFKAGDKFDRELAIKIAKGRAESGSSITINFKDTGEISNESYVKTKVPSSIFSCFMKMHERANRYFK